MKATKAITWNQLPSKPHHVLRISPPKNTKNVLHQQSTTKTIFYKQSSSIFQTNQYTTQIQRGIKGSDAQISQKELLLNFSVQLKRYVDQKDYVKAERTWQEMAAKQLPATTLNFSLIIEAFGKQGKWEDMFRTFKELKEHNLFPTTRMLNVMLNSLGKGGLMKELFEIYDAIKNGQLGPSVKPDIITLNSILHYLVKSGDVERMAQIFKEMHNLDVKPSLPTYALLLDGFRTAKDIDTMVEIWKVMKTENIKPSILVHNYMIEGFAAAGRIDEMERQVRAMREDSITPDLYTYNSLLLGYATAGQEGTMLEIFRVLKAEGFQPDQNSYVPILRYYSEINPDLEKLTFYQQLMESEHIPHCPTTLNPLLLIHAKNGNLALLDQYFEAIQSQVSYLAPVFSLILHNAAKAGQVRVLGAYYSKMVDLGLPTDIRIYNCLIHGYGKKGFAETMWYYFQKMLESGVEPNIVTCNLLIQGFGISSKEFNRAWEIYESLVSNNAHAAQPDAFTFQLAIFVAFRENNFDKIPKVLQDMKKFEIPITERTESSLVQGFSKSGKFKEAAEALLRMRSQGMTWDKDVGVFLENLIPECSDRKQELLAVWDRMKTNQSMTEREAAWFSSFLSEKITEK